MDGDPTTFLGSCATASPSAVALNECLHVAELYSGKTLPDGGSAFHLRHQGTKYYLVSVSAIAGCGPWRCCLQLLQRDSCSWMLLFQLLNSKRTSQRGCKSYLRGHVMLLHGLIKAQLWACSLYMLSIQYIFYY